MQNVTDSFLNTATTLCIAPRYIAYSGISLFFRVCPLNLVDIHEKRHISIKIALLSNCI